MGSQKISQKSQTSCVKLAAFLRQVADELDGGTLCLANIELKPHEPVEIQSVVKAKMSKTSWSWELKIKGCGELDRELIPKPPIDDELTSEQHTGATEHTVVDESRGDPNCKLRYKTVKKRMSKQLKQIRTSLTDGAVPAEDVLMVFLDDCHLITEYQGKGDPEEYRLHLEQAAALRAAFEAADLEAMRDAVSGLKEREKACHAKYK